MNHPELCKITNARNKKKSRSYLDLFIKFISMNQMIFIRSDESSYDIFMQTQFAESKLDKFVSWQTVEEIKPS